jgi:hypothetical protein
MFLNVPVGRVELRTGAFTIDLSRRQRLERTLSILPQQHLRGLQYIEIRDRVDYAGGGTNVARHSWPTTAPGRRQYWVMLDIDSFSPERRAINNRPDGLHYTLLHEMGHVVDWSTGAFRWIRQHDRAGYRLIASRSHTGRLTTGEQEKFADTYADLFFYPQGNGLRDDCIRVILNSPAFTGLPPYTRLPNGWSVPTSTR